MAISAYSATPASNTAISGINIAENCNASNINDAIRQLMADLVGPTFTTLGASGISTLQALLDISGAAAGQIKFPATQNPSANANTLDDYEEGTCTLTDASGGTTVTDNGSTYTKVGRKVTVIAFLSFGGAGNGSSSALTGLPFVCRSHVSAMALGNTSQASGLAFVPTINTTSGGFSTLIGLPTAVINSALNSTQLSFELTYFTD